MPGLQLLTDKVDKRTLLLKNESILGRAEKPDEAASVKFQGGWLKINAPHEQKRSAMHTLSINNRTENRGALARRPIGLFFSDTILV